MTEEYEMNMKQRAVEVSFDTELVKQFVMLGGKVSRCGDQFNALIGSNPMEGCEGFHKTRSGAIQSCMHNWYNENAR
jgi:hypothetical protein